MEALEQGKLKITGAGCLGAVEEAYLRQTFGCHGMLEATVWLQPGQESTGGNERWEGMPVSLSPVGEGTAPIFSGLVQRACIRKIKGRPAVRLEAASHTMLLDKGEMERSFQEESRTYGELVSELLASYGGACIWGGEGKDTKVGRFLMQYKETDWQFLCRVASLQGCAVIPEVRFPGVKLYIGVPEAGEAQLLEADAWRIRKTLAKTPGMVDNGMDGILSGGSEIVVEERYEDYCPGDTVLFHGERLVVSGKVSRFSGNQWVHDYTLRTEVECRVDRICNPKLSGAAIKGTVLETTLTSSRLSLETDGAGEGQESFHIQPVYYAGGGKGYSGQPEKGDTQYLYFPTMREEDRYIIGCVDAGVERIEAILEAAGQETAEAGEKPETPGGSIVSVGTAFAGNGGESTGGGGILPGRSGMSSPAGSVVPGVGNGASGQGGASTAKNWSTPGSRSLILDEAGVKLRNTGKGRTIVNTTGIQVSTTGSLELEALEIKGHGQDVTITAADYVWMHSGDSGILLTPEGIQIKSAELELKSPLNIPREVDDDDSVQRLLKELEEKKRYLPPYAASDGSIIRREGFNDILYSDEMLRYFEENVYGTGEYANPLGQPITLFYDSWLEEIYGRTEAQKFWDHMKTLDGLQDALGVVGIFFDPADVVNVVISLCRRDWKNFWINFVCAIPAFGSLLGKGIKGLKGMFSAGTDLAAGAVKSSDEIIDTLRLTYRASGDAADLGRYLDDVMDMIPAGGNVRLVKDGVEILDGDSRVVLEIYDDAGNVVSRISCTMDDIAGSRVAGELGGTGRLDDAEDILSATKELDGTGGGGLKTGNGGKINEGSTDVLDEIKRIDEIKVEFNYNSKYDETEFVRQLADQQKGMNELTVQEYLDNRQRYIEQGRAIESNAAQQAAREKAFVDKVDELQDAGLSLEEAEEQAQKWLDTQAALHNPDQVAGGYASNVGGVGDKGVNSSIGSQWRYRIDDVDAQIQEMAESMSEAERNSTYLNVNLIYKGD